MKKSKRYRISGSLSVYVSTSIEIEADPLLHVDDDGKPSFTEDDARVYLWDALLEKLREGDFDVDEDDIEVDDIKVAAAKGAK